MHRKLLVTTLLVALAAPAYAQTQPAEKPYSRTLDEQLRRVQQGQPAMPRRNDPAPLMEAQPASGSNMNGDMGGDTYGSIPALPLSEMTSGEVHYITGGIGDEEVAQLKSRNADFNLQALLSATSGEYISGATVAIKDASGAEVFNAANIGPYLYAKLTPGNYTLHATSESGESKSVKIRVPASGATKPQLRFSE